MTHEERVAKAAAAMSMAIPQTEECAVLLIVASPGKGFSVVSNLPNEGKVALLEDVLHGYEHDHMAREAPKNVQ